MATAVMVSVEGVLSKGNLPNAQPIDIGIEMVFGFKKFFKVILSTFCEDDDWVQHWLTMNALQELHYMKREPMDGDLTHPEMRLRHIKTFRANGWQLGLVIDADAYVCAETTRMGVSTMCFTHSRHGKPRSVRAWAELEQASTEQRRLVPPQPVEDANR